MNTGEPSFVTLVMLGKIADPETVIDDYVSRWHEDDQEPIALHHYLGMSLADYGLWMQKPDALQVILAEARRRWNDALEGTKP